MIAVVAVLVYKPSLAQRAHDRIAGLTAAARNKLSRNG